MKHKQGFAHAVFKVYPFGQHVFFILLLKTAGQTLTGSRICMCVRSGGRGVL